MFCSAYRKKGAEYVSELRRERVKVMPDNLYPDYHILFWWNVDGYKEKAGSFLFGSGVLDRNGSNGSPQFVQGLL
jgi:hypothetical protein